MKKEIHLVWSQFLLKLPTELTIRIAEKAAELNISKTALIRLAVTMFLDGLKLTNVEPTVTKKKPSTRKKK